MVTRAPVLKPAPCVVGACHVLCTIVWRFPCKWTTNASCKQWRQRHASHPNARLLTCIHLESYSQVADHPSLCAQWTWSNYTPQTHAPLKRHEVTCTAPCGGSHAMGHMHHGTCQPAPSTHGVAWPKNVQGTDMFYSCAHGVHGHWCHAQAMHATEHYTETGPDIPAPDHRPWLGHQ